MTNDINYKLIRSKRKTLSLIVRKNGELEVKAPMNISKKDIDEFVKFKEKWIKKHQENNRKNNAIRLNFQLNFNDEVLVKGKKVKILPSDENYGEYKDNTFFIPKNSNPDLIKWYLIKIYKLIAKDYLTKRTKYFANILNLKPTKIGVTNAKTRWGSCSGKNSINFSWKIIMADDEIIDYLIIHELSHIKEKNHSQKFWNEVEKVLPDYKHRQAKLKEFEKKISKENWDLAI
ncbi:MAG: M48 family metallopeptidase [Methanobrevibacter sp.]|jgi:predicted metal-dependent hydrolase|nr:M48 family metallopeptidase [Candidatus Methanoflexus mossambicus]